ncbi:hypothetical protein [Maribacter antarcticus]|uniref:hypothetical protein n=1 Tax=Maribacter antarcticus TaxID=505250 RepID=UPI00047AA854|nr:hypothetical protein [Maribacter antarcticus]
MKHRFYNKNKNERNQIQIIIALSALTIILTSLFLSWKTGTYIIGMLTFPIVLSIIAPFFDTPALKKNGKLFYYSSLFIAEQPKNEIITIHGGTLLDYFFVIDRKMNGKQRTNFIIQKYLQGVLCLIEKYEDTKKTNLKICGTSYIINVRTAEKLGFKIKKTDFLQKMILTYNYFNLLISNSIAKNKISFPNLKKTRTFEADLNQLIERKTYIIELNNKLKSTITNTVYKT